MYLLSKEQEKLRSDVRSFVDAEVIPVSAQLDAGGELPREIFKELGTRGYLDASFAFPGTAAHYNALDGTIITKSSRAVWHHWGLSSARTFSAQSS